MEFLKLIGKYIDKRINYDGTQLRSLWAFRQFGIQGDSIISFRGKCDVPLSNMADVLDVLNKDSIFSEDMLHFIVEHFDMDLEKTIIRQRLLMCIIKDLIENCIGCSLMRDGDDLYKGDLKLSVSIAVLSPVSSMIHTGINISSKNTPIKTVGLYDLGCDDSCVVNLAKEVCNRYVLEMQSIKMARCKVRGVD